MLCNTATKDGIVEEFTRRENTRVCGGGGVAVVGSRFQMEGRVIARACCPVVLHAQSRGCSVDGGSLQVVGVEDISIFFCGPLAFPHDV